MWITAEKVDKSVKKRFSHQEVGKSSEKRGFYISLPKKMFTLHYAILCTTMDLSGASCITLCTYRIYYTTISSLYFICNGFSHFYYLLSQLFLFFKCYFLLYIYILWFHILLSLRCFGSAFLYMAVLFLFSFALLMWKSLFSADNSFFVVQLYIGISPIILFKKLTLFMCSNLLVRHYYLSCLCLYRLSLCKNKYVS